MSVTSVLCLMTSSIDGAPKKHTLDGAIDAMSVLCLMTSSIDGAPK